jgi:hypothetical protein
MEFNKLIRLLIPCTVEGVLKTPKLSRERVVENLNKVSFLTRSITEQDEETIIELQILDESALFVLLAGEAHNFFLASVMTYDRAKQLQPGNAAWQVIEHYYAAYYALHYLMRITGVSLTNIDHVAEKAIINNQIIAAANRVTKIPKGNYVLHYDESRKLIFLRKINRKGGSHVEAWKLWLELINKLNENTNTDTIEYATVSIGLNAHKNFLMRSTGVYNPPEIRGEINYQFKGGLWSFEKNPNASIRKAQTLMAQQALPTAPMKVNPDAMVANNNVIINLAKQMFLHSSRNYPRSICSSLANQYRSYLTQ